MLNTKKWLQVQSMRYGAFLRRLKLWQRLLFISLAALMLFAAVAPAWQALDKQRAYALSASTIGLIGATAPGLANKFSYDQQNDVWQFNKAGLVASTSSIQAPAEVAQALQAKVGGTDKKDTSLYSVNLPIKAAQPIGYYDSNTGLSFTLTPEFKTGDGQKISDKLVYPLQSGAKLVYSAKTNGMKEDIVLTKPLGDTLQFNYKLTLPDTLEARVQDDGSVGVFSADPALFGNISYGGNTDRAKVESARQTANKDHLLFTLPAPVIKQVSGKVGSSTSAHFVLSGNQLRVEASGMQHLQYPVSVDPSVVVTSASDFATGNNEGGIDYVNDEIRTSTLTGGTMGTWNQTAVSSTTPRAFNGATTYNGRIYVVGGDHTGNTADNQAPTVYATINADGTLSDWATTTSQTVVRRYPGLAAYNGYLYLFGGFVNGTTTPASDVQYAPINNDGSIGAWTTSAQAMATPACRAGSFINNGYLYAVGGATGTVAASCGNSSTTVTNILQYAPIKANGDVGSWTVSANTFTNARMSAMVGTYNNYVYLVGGTVDGATSYKDTQYAPILANGNIGTWKTSATQLVSSLYRSGVSYYKGYIYIMGGGSTGAGILYAAIKSNGDIGTWQNGTALTQAVGAVSMVASGNYLYQIFGDAQSGTGDINTSYYSQLSSPGATTSTTASTSFGASVTASTGAGVFVNGNYIYSIGGYDGSAYSSMVRYATLAADGTIGTWATTSALAAPMSGATGLASFGLAVYNNYVYAIAGTTSVGGTATFASSVQYATFNTNGTLNAWTLNSTDYPGAVTNQPAAVYNGYIYMRGFSGGGASNRVYSVAINSDGTLGTWTFSSTNLNVYSSYYGTLTVYGSYLYSVGGISSSSTYLNGVEYAAINSDGTLGTWTATSNLVTGRDRHTVVAYNNCLYALGGQIDATPTSTATVEKSCINNDGSLGNWSNTAAMGFTADTFGSAVYADRIYVISGTQNGSRVKTNYYITVSNGGSAAVGAWSTSANTFTNGRFAHGSVVYNGYIYILGGKNSSTRFNDVQYATISNGLVGTWYTTTSLPATVASQVTQTYNGYIYSCGGRNDTTAQSTCFYAKINTDGSLGSWLSTSNLPASRDAATSTIANGYMYILGGSTALASVIYATINADGSLGSWTATTPMPNGHALNGAVATNKYIYSLGGYSTLSNVYTNEVVYAPLNGDGSVGTWASTTNLRNPRNYLSPLIINGNLYIFGGAGGTVNYTNVEYAPINTNGTIGSWTNTTALTTTRYGHAAVYYQGYIYTTGGATAYLNTVQSAPVSSMPRIGQFSKLIDLGGSYNLSSIVTNGSGGQGAYNVSFKAANSSGVFGSAQLPNSITAAAACAVGTTRYVFLQANLDATLLATFPDTFSNKSVINDITVNYTATRPDTSKRLHQGKSFASELLQPLDTCGP